MPPPWNTQNASLVVVGDVHRWWRSADVAFLERARPGGPSGKHYRIVVENPFHLAMLDTPEHLRLMGDTLAGLTGQARAIRLELAAGSATAAAPGPRISAERAAEARREQALSDHADSPLIQDLLQRFDGEVLED